MSCHCYIRLFYKHISFINNFVDFFFPLRASKVIIAVRELLTFITSVLLPSQITSTQKLLDLSRMAFLIQISGLTREY